MFDATIANFKHKVDRALKSAIGLAIAGATGLVALGFFCAALFMWIEQRLGAIDAALILGGAFAAVAILALLTVMVLRSRRPPPPPPPRKAAWWADPALMKTALDIGRTLGRQRVTAAILAGAFVLGILLNRPPRDPDAPPDAP